MRLGRIEEGERRIVLDPPLFFVTCAGVAGVPVLRRRRYCVVREQHRSAQKLDV
jgi:hypothetical protein